MNATCSATEFINNLNAATKLVETTATTLYQCLQNIVSLQWMVKFNAKEGRRYVKYRADLSVEWKCLYLNAGIHADWQHIRRYVADD